MKYDCYPFHHDIVQLVFFCLFVWLVVFFQRLFLHYFLASYAVSSGRVTANYEMKRKYNIVAIAYFKALLQIFHRLKKTMIILSTIAGL